MPTDINPALDILRRQAKAAEDAMYDAQHRLSLAVDEATRLERDLRAKRAEGASWEAAAARHQEEFAQLRRAIEAATGESYY